MAKYEHSYQSPMEELDMLTGRLHGSSPFEGRIKPVETSRGLVSVRADMFLGGITTASVVVVYGDTVSAAYHVMNHEPFGEAKPQRLPTEHVTCLIGDGKNGPNGLDHVWSNDPEIGKSPHFKTYGIVRSIIHNVANTGSAYDALHQNYRMSFPDSDDHVNFPYAGMEYGPAVNLISMLNNGRGEFHPAVIEAALELPVRK